MGPNPLLVNETLPSDGLSTEFGSRKAPWSPKDNSMSVVPLPPMSKSNRASKTAPLGPMSALKPGSNNGPNSGLTPLSMTFTENRFPALVVGSTVIADEVNLVPPMVSKVGLKASPPVNRITLESLVKKSRSRASKPNSPSEKRYALPAPESWVSVFKNESGSNERKRSCENPCVELTITKTDASKTFLIMTSSQALRF